MLINPAALWLLPFVVAMFAFVAYFIGRASGDEKHMIEKQDLLNEIGDLLLQLHDISNKERDAIRAAKFRQRTQGTDPNRQTKVKKARVRAYKSTTPDPRK